MKKIYWKIYIPTPFPAPFRPVPRPFKKIWKDRKKWTFQTFQSNATKVNDVPNVPITILEQFLIEVTLQIHSKMLKNNPLTSYTQTISWFMKKHILKKHMSIDTAAIRPYPPSNPSMKNYSYPLHPPKFDPSKTYSLITSPENYCTNNVKLLQQQKWYTPYIKKPG